MNTLFSIGAVSVTAYALGMALSLAACAVLVFVCFLKAGLPRIMAERFLLLALPLGYVLARLSYVLLRLPYFLERGDGLALRLWQGGYTLWGVLAALVLAGLITAKGHRASFGKTMDALAAPSLLLLALGRFSEGLAGMALGRKRRQLFPFSHSRWATNGRMALDHLHAGGCGGAGVFSDCHQAQGQSRR